MTVLRIEAGSFTRSVRPSWLSDFARHAIAPNARREVIADAQAVLVYVIDGVLLLDEAPPGLNRALPGELVCAVGRQVVAYGNGSKTDDLLVCQWRIAGGRSTPAQLTQRYFSDDDQRGALCLIASADGDGGALAHGADARAWIATLGKSETILHNPVAGACNWLYVLAGEVSVNGQEVSAGRAALIEAEDELRLTAQAPSQLILLEGH